MQRKSMDIKDFIKGYNNYPVLFIGTGFSLRYLNNSFTWDNLLKKIALDIYNSEEKYFDIKAKHIGSNNYCNYAAVATELEKDFNEEATKIREGIFKEVNDIYYQNINNNNKVSRFKIYISNMLKDLDINESDDIKLELEALKNAKKNISSIITTNYDQLAEELFEFTPLIGNNIVLKNPYGSAYKIHGCVTNPDDIIITASDYNNFDKKYEFIKAQLLSIFIHNPIIFIGYSISDENIKGLLKTIFSNIPANSEISKKIRNNFLLIEHDRGSDSTEVIEHDIDLLIDGESTVVRINKITTDNYANVYNEIANLSLPISAMDIKRVQSVLRDIITGETADLVVKIASDIDDINNHDMVLAIGTKNSVSVKESKAIEWADSLTLLINYFDIIDNSNNESILSLDKLTISSTQYFPFFGFGRICNDLQDIETNKSNQKLLLSTYIRKSIKPKDKIDYKSINAIIRSKDVTQSNKQKVIFWNIYIGNISLSKTKEYLLSIKDEINTDYRRLLSLYDYKKNNPRKAL